MRQDHLRECYWHMAQAEKLMIMAGIPMAEIKQLQTLMDITRYEHDLTISDNYERVR